MKVESFYKRRGTSDRGKEYESVAVVNVVLQLVNDATINDFHISSNDKNFGAFDDLVIKLESDKGTEVKAIQLKHSCREILPIETLKSKKGDFSIIKYFQSFQEIKNEADEFILFTNRSFSVDNNVKFQLEGEEFRIKPIKVNRSLPLSNDGNYVYQFQIIEDQSVAKNVLNIKEFFNKFYLYTNQENFDTLRNSTSNKFKKMFSSNEDIFDKLMKIIWEWYMQEGKKQKLNKKWMQRVIALQLLSSQIEPVSFGLVNDKMKILRDAIFSFDITLFEKHSGETVKQLWGDIGKENIDFEELNRVGRNYQLTTRYIDRNNIDNVKPKKFAQMLWLMNKCPLILHERENLEKAIQLCLDKKFILLGERTNKKWMKNYSVFQNLSNLELKLREKMMQNFTMSIQGKKEFDLVTAFGNSEKYLENVTTDSLMEMLNGPCNIGGKKEILPEPYIERYLSQNLINNTYLEQAQENTVIILNCAGNFDKVKDKLKYCKLSDTDTILETNFEVGENLSNNVFRKQESDIVTTKDSNFNVNKPNFGNTVYITKRNCNVFNLEQIYNENTKTKNIHYFQVTNDGSLEWIKSKSKGDVSNLESYRLTNKHFTKESVLWSSHINNINLITGDPGMGKSELMKSLKNECLPEYWTVIVDPKDVNSFFTSMQVSKISNYTNAFEKFIIDEKCGSLTTLEKKIFEMSLKKNNILCVWDALDEILSEHLDAVSYLILQLSKKGFVQWVTSRQHLQTLLEKKFNVLSFHINQFSEYEQQGYIRTRLATVSSVDEIEITIQKIKSTFVIIEHVNILGIPLQIFMLTELFRTDNDKYLNLLDNTFLLTDLYHHFIEEKFIIFYKDKMAFDLQNPHLASRIRGEKQKALNHYERLAFKVIFPENILQRLNIDSQKHIEKVSKKFASLGILKEVQNNVVHFLHGSFAEYLVAIYFSKNLKDVPTDIIFDAKYDNVRFFFDMMMGKDSPAHIAVLYKNFELLKTYDDETLTRKDEGGRTPLHLICSWGQRHPRVQIKCENKVYIVDDSTSINSAPESKEYFEAVMHLQNKNNPDERDVLLNMTPLSYAKNSESLGSELKLLQIMKCELNQSCTFNDRINILYYAVLLGYDDVSELFTGQEYQNEIKFVTALNGSTPLLLASNKNYIKIVKYLVQSGAEINNTDNFGRTPLYAASVNGYDKTVEYLVKAGADINRAKNHGSTPLYVACQKGHKETVKHLVKAGAEINRATNNGGTPLYTACFNGHEKTVEYLVKAGAEINCTTNGGFTPLYVASLNDHGKTVEDLVESGAEIDRANNNGFTPLYIACQKGNQKIIEYLVRAGAQINRANNDGSTPLCIACHKGHEKIVEYLIEAGAEINCATNDGKPLYTACFNGHDKTVEYLLEAGAEINRANNNDSTPLYVASQKGHEKIVKYLVEAGAEINRATNDGCTPLYTASFNGFENTVEYLLKAGSEANRATNDGFTPLYVASQNGHEKTVEYLVKAGAQINRANNNGSTPLYGACQKGYEKTAKYLVEAGADITCATDDGDTPLYTACFNGHEKTVEYLLNVGAEINRATNDGFTPLYVASQNGHEKTVENLLNVGAEVNRATNDGFTPLYVASENGFEKTVEYLVKAGAEINCPVNGGFTPLYIASQNGHEKTVEYLVTAGAEINRAENDGWTPLHIASQDGHEKIVEYLVEAGAEINSTTNDGHTPLYTACFHGHKKIAEYLVKAGAVINRAGNDRFTPEL